MKRIRQSYDDLLDSLTLLEVDWMDHPHAESVIEALQNIPNKKRVTSDDVKALLEEDFEVAFTIIRLFLELSKDDFERFLKESFEGNGGGKVSRFREDPDAYVEKLVHFGLLEKMEGEMNHDSHWSDRLVGLFQGGWGSAVKGQLRGRALEDFVQEHLEEVFEKEQIIPRCQFKGASGLSSEKADFAIPDVNDARILIEVKAFGATGSKQTDVLGDISRIVEQKRHDTTFLLFTDGTSWKARKADFKRLVELQHLGKIQKIYTKAMGEEFLEDLCSLKRTHDL